jgi:hypothetical protein
MPLSRHGIRTGCKPDYRHPQNRSVRWPAKQHDGRRPLCDRRETRDHNGRGGSKSFIDETNQGDPIVVSAPRNEFPLDERAKAFILVAGGIGITPMLSMTRPLKAEGLRQFELYYLARDPEGADHAKSEELVLDL